MYKVNTFRLRLTPAFCAFIAGFLFPVPTTSYSFGVSHSFGSPLPPACHCGEHHARAKSMSDATADANVSATLISVAVIIDQIPSRSHASPRTTSCCVERGFWHLATCSPARHSADVQVISPADVQFWVDDTSTPRIPGAGQKEPDAAATSICWWSIFQGVLGAGQPDPTAISFETP